MKTICCAVVASLAFAAFGGRSILDKPVSVAGTGDDQTREWTKPVELGQWHVKGKIVYERADAGARRATSAFRIRSALATSGTCSISRTACGAQNKIAPAILDVLETASQIMV